MKALSVRQPWAWLIGHGYKPVENRSWRTSYRGPLYIHASSRLDPDFKPIREFCLSLGIDLPISFDLGGLVAQVELVDCVIQHDSPFFSGPYGFVFKNARLIPFQPCKGQLSFFTPRFT